MNLKKLFNAKYKNLQADNTWFFEYYISALNLGDNPI